MILDNELYSAPSIQSTIYDSGEITGSFTPQEVQDLVNVLDAGRLPAALTKEPISKLFSGPTLGRDTIQKSTRAMLISAVLVVVFMLYYYRFSGIVANIALALNMLILFAVMLAFKAAFTLTGFAGLALTVGMAVDNNILVFERLRERVGPGGHRAHGHPQRLPPGGGHDHRLQHHPPHRRHRALLDRQRPDPGLRHYRSGSAWSRACTPRSSSPG